MKIKKLFKESMGYSMVVEREDGSFSKFLMTPARKIAENDLTPLPYYRPVGRAAEEAPKYMYTMYGLTK